MLAEAEWVTCRCPGGKCRADLRDRLPFDLAITAGFMEGDVLPNNFGVGQLRLRHVQ
jgi:hypothetical protein